MGQQFPAGTPVIGKIENTAVSASAGTLSFKDVNGGSFTFVAGTRLIIYEIHVNNRATAKDLTLFQDADNDGAIDAGEQILAFSFAAAGFGESRSERGIATVPINAAANNLFKVLASAAGSVDVTLVGEVIKS